MRRRSSVLGRASWKVNGGFLGKNLVNDFGWMIGMDTKSLVTNSMVNIRDILSFPKHTSVR